MIVAPGGSDGSSVDSQRGLGSMQPMHRAPGFIWLPIPLFSVAIVALAVAGSRTTYGTQWASVALNALILLFASLVSAVLAAMAYLRGSSRTVLSLGTGMLCLGLAGLAAAVLVSAGYRNGGVASYNLLALLSGSIVLWGGIDASLSRGNNKPRRANSVAVLALAYGSCLLVVGAITVLARSESMPLFMTPDGPTHIRTAVLTATVAEFFFAALIFALLARYVGSTFLGWYWPGLVLIGIGIGAVAMTVLGTGLNWTGRTAQALGQAYIAIGIVTLARRAGPASAATALSDVFARLGESIDVHRRLLEAVFDNIPAQINLMRASDLRIELVNPAYQAIAPGKKMIGRTLNEIWPETGVDFGEICQNVIATGVPYEVVDDPVHISRSPGGPLETRYFTWTLIPVHLPDGTGGILNMSVETTDRKHAEQALRKLDEHKLEFYRRTIFAATEGKLVVCSRGEIDDAAGEPACTMAINDFDDAPKAAAAAREFARKAGMAEQRIDDFMGCITEATANALKHAQGGELSLHSPEGKVMCVVSDSGAGIGAMELPDVALTRFYSTAGTLGMGYKLMIKFADRVYLSTGPAGTTLALEMSLTAPEPALIPDIASL